MSLIKNYNITDHNVKKKIIKYLFSSDVKSDFNVSSIKKDDIDNIKKDKYVLIPQYDGSRVWILFIKLGEIYYAVNIPLKKNNDYDNVTIYPLEIQVSKELYNGTILQGTYYKDVEKNKRGIIIDDVFKYAGEYQYAKSRVTKINFLKLELKNKIINNDFNFNLSISNIYKIDRDSLQEFYNKIRKDTSIIGIYFVPNTIGEKIYNYLLLNEDYNDNIKQISVFIMKKTKKKYVYKLFNSEDEYIGIAYIPDIQTNKRCLQWFNTTKKNTINVKCICDNDKNKWIPIEMV